MRLHAIAVASVVGLALTAAAVGPVFYGDAPDDHHPWAVHDRNRPQPPVVTPGTGSTQEQPGKPPSDAIVLFDGTDLSQWEADTPNPEPTKWVIRDGAMECVPGSGYIRTKRTFGDMQLHIEWAAPAKVVGNDQGRGNSGVFLMGIMEIQVLDNYDNPTYADGTAGAVYDVMPPMANALRPPGQFQSYDIVFRRPIYQDGQVVDPGYVTVFENGVLVQDHTQIEGPTSHMVRSRPGPFPDAAPLKLQDHGNPVRYRNIWCRPLPPRAVEGGTDGYLTTAATQAKRQEIAASIRQHAAQLATTTDPLPALYLWLESLEYEQNPAALQHAEQGAERYVASLKALSPERLAAKKDEVRRLRDVFNFLVRFHALSGSFAPKQEIDQIIASQRWDAKP
jgi:hypothetical protein